MAPKRTKAKSGSGYSRVETNIYREVRSDAAVRFRVSVYPLKPVTKTCDLADEADGLDWAQGVRLELLRQKRSLSGSRADQSPVYTPNESARQPAPPSAVEKTSNGSLSPEAVTVDAILTWYEKHGIPLLSTAGSRSAESSRVRKLREVFGPRTLEDLTEVEIEAWIQRRLRGEGGGARSAWRNERHRDTRVLTKDQRRRLRASIARGDASAAKDLRPAANPVNAVSKVTSPSTQTVRHELRVLRSACKSFFRAGQWAKARGWLAATPLMTMPFPQARSPDSGASRQMRSNGYSRPAIRQLRGSLSASHCRRRVGAPNSYCCYGRTWTSSGASCVFDGPPGNASPRRVTACCR
ncbi:MAG: hypothetical protein NTW15_23115 [Burkholderiales bacterium]|nr:hypothetical protein [Burkholderiales bacterium]